MKQTNCESSSAWTTPNDLEDSWADMRRILLDCFIFKTVMAE